MLAGCATSRPYVAPEHEAWAQQTTPAEAEQIYQVFLLGDAGDNAASPALTLLRTKLAEADAQSAVVFLGDNLYPAGLPDSSAADWTEAEPRLRAQLDAVQDFAGRVVFIPGNHDWDNGGRDGLAAVRRQEAYVEAVLGRGNTFLPDDGFPGPVEVNLADDLTLVVLDTQWWLHRFDKAFGDADDYDLNEAGDFLLELEDMILKHRNENLLVVGHHPLVSNDPHGGRFSARDHFTPFPIVGTLHALYRRFIGRRQDLAHARYASLRRELMERFGVHDDLIYAAGHAHSLQYFHVGETRTFQHHLVSGAGSRPEPVAPRHGAIFTAGNHPGFLTLRYYADDSVWMEAWAADEAGEGTLLFRHQLKAPTPAPTTPPELTVQELPDYRDSTVVVAANPTYAKAGPLKKGLLGAHHRKAWGTPVTFPVLDLTREKGGLTPVKMGGRGQSESLRMRGADGHEYVARSIDKVAGRVWPKELQATFAQRLVQDQFSMLHPFAAFIVPPLADAVGVYHANPRYFIMPDDPRLGPYRERMAGRVVLFEERPDDDMSHLASVGGSEDVIGYTALFREITNDNDHRVDAHAWARARLFDLLLADWDRHVDQWRWASFEPYELDSTLTGDARTAGKIYRPIPRDRDVAFMRFDGLLPTIATYTIYKNYQDFQHHYGNLKGLINNGVDQDFRFAAGLTQEDWLAEAQHIQAALTDAVIEDAVRGWPDPIFALNGEEVIDKLKTRRDTLGEIAAQYYHLLARIVEVVGSNKHERFEVTRFADGQTEVVVQKTNKEGEVRSELFRRIFNPDETKEIRLFGLDGNDQFVIHGEAQAGTLVRAIGGPGEDRFEDTSTVHGSRKLTRFYDTTADNTWVTGSETRVHQSDDPAINAYNLGTHHFHEANPVAFFGFNKDDGVLLGGGAVWTRHGFRKDPFAYQHRVMANASLSTDAFNARYVGHYTDVLGTWDMGLDASVFSPNSIRNFYGLGNETANTAEDAQFYQARFSRVVIAPSFIQSLDEGIEVFLSPSFEYTNVRLDEDRFVAQPQAGISATTFEDQWFGGAEIGVTLHTTDDAANPQQGFRWTTSADLNVGLRNSSETYTTLASALALYVSPSLSPQVTVAVQVGGAHTEGDFPFYSANTLGGSANLRGYRNTRFAGRSTFYQNADLRIQAFRFANYFGYGTVGVLGFFDNGRVWTDGEDSDVWHQGYGGGVWLALLNQFVLTGTYGLSDENKGVTVRFGFQF